MDEYTPVIDGFWSENEWPDFIISESTFTDNVKIQYSYRVNDSHLIFTAKYHDDSPTHTESEQDALAITFDNNGDQRNMGSFEDPDDSVFIGFYGNMSMDVYMQGIGKKIIDDTSVGGTNDTFGRYSLSNDNFYTYEFIKPLKSNDTNGHDIQLNKGDSIYIMFAYWDNLSPFEEISGFTDWIKLVILDPIHDKPNITDFVFPITLSLFVVITLVVLRIKT